MFRSNNLLLLVRLLRFHLLSTSHSPGVMALALLVWLAGCDPSSEVTVRVSIPNADSVETPAAGVGIIALPYDRDSVLESLEAKAPTPRPHTTALESLFARFRAPFTTYTAAAYSAAALRDSIDQLRGRLDTLPPKTEEYRALHANYERLSDSLARVERQVERARVRLNQARAEFIDRSESLRANVRQWEDSTYRGYDSIVANLARSRGREALTDTTGPDGWVRFTLPPGRWWLYARAWDVGDPNAEWYWNTPVEDDTVLLSSRNARHRVKY